MEVNATWYKNGSELDINDSLYRVSSVEELRIRSLSVESVGYYVCVTELPLGRYRTVDSFIGLSGMHQYIHSYIEHTMLYMHVHVGSGATE